MVNWTAKFSDGSEITDSTSNASWKKLAKDVLHDGRKIVSLMIHNEKGAGRIDDNKDGYFIGNKIIAGLAKDHVLEFTGIGYWQKSDNTARIKWYDSKTMELFKTEARSPEDCGLSLIINP